jgi:hypothetical protein
MKHPPKPNDRAGRQERLRSALRENLKRRKAQAKARSADRTESTESKEAGPNSAGIVDDKGTG